MTSPNRFKQIQSLFDAASVLAVEHRKAYIVEIASGDHELVSEVLSLLEYDHAVRDKKTDQPFAVATDALHAQSSASLIDKQIGRYQLLAEIGSGGMGRVFKAARIDGEVEQIVAIKLLHFHRHEPEFARRFVRERQILASLSHPNIARFLDAGTDNNGQPFVVIEYIEGLAIVDYANHHQLALSARINLLLKVMDAVAYSHRQLVLHRDIKSSNVLVNEKGEPFLLDFGIAKPMQAPGEQIVAESETAIEHRIFSLGHAAPEQLRGSKMGTGCDIYGLGVLAYELACDIPPLQLRGLSYKQAEDKILHQFPVAPSVAKSNNERAPDRSDYKVWRRALRGDLDNIILHALKKTPEDRYATVDAFAGDFRRFLQNESISLRSHQRWYRAKQFVKRNKLAVSFSASLFLALASSSLVLYQQNKNVQTQRNKAIAQSTRAETLSKFLIGSFEAADPSRNQGNKVSAKEVLDQAARKIKTENLDPATNISMLNALADVYRTMGELKESVEIATRATRVVGEVEPLLRAKSWRLLAAANYLLFKTEEAEKSLFNAKEKISKLSDTTIDEVEVEKFEQELLGIQILALKSSGSANLDLYRALYQKAQRQLKVNHPVTIQIGLVYANTLMFSRQLQKSNIVVDEILKLIPYPEKNPDGLKLLSTKARNQRELGQIDQALITANKYLDGVKNLYGENHRFFIIALDITATLYQAKGNYQKTLENREKILEIADQLTGEKDTWMHASAFNNRATVQLLLNKTAEAEESSIRAKEIADFRLLPDNTNRATLRITLAQIQINLGKNETAVENLEQAERIFANVNRPNAPEIHRGLGLVVTAEALLNLGRIKDARNAYQNGMAKIEGHLDHNSSNYRDARKLGERIAELTK